MNVLQTHRTQNAAAVADAAGISGRHAGTLALPAAFGSARNRPGIRLRRTRSKPWFSEYCGPTKPVSVKRFERFNVFTAEKLCTRVSPPGLKVIRSKR